jgi:fatty acid desaturase
MAPENSANGGNRVQVLEEFQNSDHKAVRNEYYFRTPLLVNWMMPMLKDQRDEPMLCLLLNIIEVLVPGMAIVITVNLWQPPFPLLVRNIAGLCYVLTVLLGFQERFTLFLHFSAHRPIFKNENLNGIMNWIVAPFFGIPCGIYKMHHVVMHHIENNHDLDASSTERYQRDSLMDFFRYWVHFAILIWIELPVYTITTKRYSWLAKCLTGLSIWVASMLLLARCVNPLAAFWILGVPHIIAMTAMAFGNWSQHIFVDPQNYESNYGLTYNCMDCPGNQKTFNDGYHVVHHLNARLHWTEMPGYFHETVEKHRANAALTFRGIHFFDVGLLVMTGNLRKLVQKHYVHLGSKDTAPTVDAMEETLRARLRPVLVASKASKEAKKAD